jgi:hypothetical protein
MCDCIKINYIPIGSEPITIEVISNGVEVGKNYYEFSIPSESSGCDTISVTYTLVGEEPVTVEVESSGVDPETGKPYYENVYIGGDGQVYPLINEFYNNWAFIFENDVQAIAPLDTPCPFGTYTILEGSIFEAFSIAPVTEQLFTVSWDGVSWNLVDGENTLWELSEDTDCPIGTWTNVDDTTNFSGFSIEECNPRKTVTYSKVAEGWNSFWSYQPDWMTEMNSIFYTFKNGELWRHNVNTTRNNFYGEQYSSTIRGIFNNDPLTVKMFNTLSLNSTKPWSADVYTNINAGAISYTYFVEKEGQWFSYIRRFDDTIDVKALSTQGIGSPSLVTTVSASLVDVSFSFKLDSSISVGDQVYKNSSGNLVLIGTITELATDIMRTDISVGGAPTTSDFLICVKNSQTESFGARGYYMNVYLSNDLTEQVKLFSIGTSVFKSFL